MSSTPLWNRYQKHLCHCDSIGLTLDVSRMRFPEGFLDTMADPWDRALDTMAALEGGALANADEQRMVGHYWLRNPTLAPRTSIRRDIEESLARIRALAGAVHRGEHQPQGGDRFRNLAIVGIGGSALGPQLVGEALATAGDSLTPYFFDNTDPDGMDRLLDSLGDELGQTLTLVISKSGGTKETRNAMVEIADRYRARNLSFPSCAVAVTCPGSELDRLAIEESWLARFPLWDWVGGRTSVFSAVGLLPTALQGIDVSAFLAGAREADRLTRNRRISTDRDHEGNPAALLALMWHHAGDGQGKRDMVILPYKDRLALFGRYLQQLVMESLGKRVDRQGRTVHQGLTVYGNKGSTDQHAFIQQLQEGPDDYFATFIEVLRDRTGASLQVEPEVTSGDYLHGFLMGTREALYEAGRDSITITLDELSPPRLGALIAVFERAVGLYAELIDINAYHQPGVEAGKRAAAKTLALQGAVISHLRAHRGEALSADEVAEAIERAEQVEDVYHILVHLAANPDRQVHGHPASVPTERRFSLE